MLILWGTNCWHFFNIFHWILSTLLCNVWTSIIFSELFSRVNNSKNPIKCETYWIRFLYRQSTYIYVFLIRNNSYWAFEWNLHNHSFGRIKSNEKFIQIIFCRMNIFFNRSKKWRKGARLHIHWIKLRTLVRYGFYQYRRNYHQACEKRSHLFKNTFSIVCMVFADTCKMTWAKNKQSKNETKKQKQLLLNHWQYQRNMMK